MLKNQRKVNDNLGKNIIKDHIIIYDFIEKRIGKYKNCNFGHKYGSITGVRHEGDPIVPIKEFELRDVKIIENEVIINKGDGLQGFCKNCSKLRRKARIEKEKLEKNNKTSDEIYELYKEKYGKDCKICSRCKIEKSIQLFNLSIGMECGIHNMCKLCCYEYGSSIGNRWFIYLPDGNYKINKKLKDQHDDHIFPLSLGGSNNKINHQLISSKENLTKSNNLSYFKNIDEINPEMISERFRYILEDTCDLNELKIKLSKLIYDDIKLRGELNDDELFSIYKSYCLNNNLKKDINRAIIKFKEYYSQIFS
jgi:hypothetical protein